MSQSPSGLAIRVRGTVQGVGFRPHVFQLASKFGVRGIVLNDGQGVLIQAVASPAVLNEFIRAIKDNGLPLAKVESIDCSAIELDVDPGDFRIVESAGGIRQTAVSADAATCSACLEDIFSVDSRRFAYPFTNCTHCGPRLSIIKSIPYDRGNTSMDVFPLCFLCKKEYEDISDRRFHAQPNACPDCGPQVALEVAGNSILPGRDSFIDVVKVAVGHIRDGKIVAIKGIGGFQLLCDATNESAVNKLRQRKRRYEKPFALMAASLSIVKEHCLVSDREAAVLASPAAPILVLKSRRETSASIAASVNPGQNTLGFMLPYSPLHHLLLKDLQMPAVCTSANSSEEPQCIDDDEARERLADIADFILLHNRRIINRVDDSVFRYMAERPRALRRARGYAPAPIALPPGFEKAPAVLAMGGELKNTFCLLSNGSAVLSQHMGDLADLLCYREYKRSIALFQDLFQHRAQCIAVDLHPDYLSTKLGQEMALSAQLSLEYVQHHHAHIASCMGENGYALQAKPVLGIALDGLGYGDDAGYWGGEFLLADYSSFKRIGSLNPVALLGGNLAMREPWRNTYAHIISGFGWAKFRQLYPDLELTKFLEGKPLSLIDSMLKSGTNCPLSSSCGRLFDAFAAAIGVCRERQSFEGQAAMELEALVDLTDKFIFGQIDQAAYPFDIRQGSVDDSWVEKNLAINSLAENSWIPYIDSGPMWQALFQDLNRGVEKGLLALKFHRGLALAICEMAMTLNDAGSIKKFDTVVLSGGVFQNRILLEYVVELLESVGFRVLAQKDVPANDGGLSFGQALVAAARRIDYVSRNSG